MSFSDVRADQKLLDVSRRIVDSRLARIAEEGTPFEALPVQWAANSELERTWGIRLFN